MRIDLKPYEKSMRELNKGTCKKYFFKINGKTFVFKANYNRFDSEAKNEYFKQFFSDDIIELNGDIVECFSYYFLKHIGCDFCLPYKFAKIDNKMGCISPSFITKDVLYDKSLKDILMLTAKQNIDKPLSTIFTPNARFTFNNSYYNELNGQYDFSVDFICDKVDQFCNKYHIKYQNKELKQKLNKIVVYDYFMINYDRNWQNINFLIKNNEGKGLNLDLGPIYDNGECFGMENFDKQPKDMDFSRNDLCIGISEIGRTNKFTHNKYFKDQRLIAIDINQLSQNNTEIKKIVEKCINMNIHELINNFEKDYDFEIPNKYKEIINKCYNVRVTNFKESNELLSKKITELSK